MAKKNLSLEEYKAKIEKKKAKREKFTKSFMTATAILLGLAIVFCATIVANTPDTAIAAPNATASSSDKKDDESNMDWDAPQDTNGDSDTSNSGDTDSNNNDNQNSDSNSNTQQGQDKTEEKKPLSTPREQFNYFLDAFKNVKKNAKSVTKYWKNDTNYKGIAEAPVGLSGLLETLLKNNLQSGDVNEQYTGEDINNAFPPKNGAECNFTTSDVKSIKCEEKDGKYIITIVCKGGVDIAAGDGVGAVASVLTKDQIYDPIKNVPVLKSIGEPTCTYEESTVVATIDKETGNLVDYYTTIPLILEFKSFGAKVGLQFEEKWSAEY